MTPFDLRKEPWIPCLDYKGPRTMSLVDVLTEAHNLREIVGDSPPATIALHRLLLAVLHRIFRGPKDAEAWSELYTRGSFDADAIRKYFDTHSDRFDLFHEKYPFYQTASVRGKVKDGAVIQLYLQAKSNATLFDHSSLAVPKELSPAEATRHLIALQGFDTAGLITGDNGNDQAKASPLIHTAICLVRGISLFDTLLLNLHRYDGLDEKPIKFDEEADKPAWEREEETIKQERWPAGPVDLLTWQSRRIALEPEPSGDGKTIVKKSVVMAGYSLPEAAKQAAEVMVAFHKKDDGKIVPVRFDENQALWRNSRSLLESATNEGFRPRILDWIDEIKHDGYLRKRKLPVDFYGLSYNPKQVAQLVFWNHERFDLPLEFLSNRELTAKLSICLNFSKEMGSALRAGVRALILALAEFADDKRKNKPEAFPAQEYYWSQMEMRFHELLGRMPLNTDEEMKAWFRDTLQIARKGLRDTVYGLSGTAVETKASVMAENEFWNKITKSVNQHINSWNIYLPLQLSSKGGEQV